MRRVDPKSATAPGGNEGALTCGEACRAARGGLILCVRSAGNELPATGDTLRPHHVVETVLGYGLRRDVRWATAKGFIPLIHARRVCPDPAAWATLSDPDSATGYLRVSL